ncbi:MAG: hypothetical protein P8P20_04420 [Acidimicrobiales bacterium]|nr:hypothetical protein [Acidimicrobiales bacterium]
MIRFSAEERRWRLAERHRLTESLRIDDVAAIADGLVALHSSDPATVHMSVLVRMSKPSIGAVEHACMSSVRSCATMRCDARCG